MSQQIQIIGFKLGDKEFGVDILCTQEILSPTPYTPIPNSDSHILGVFNLRGTITPLIDIRERLKIPIKRQSRHTKYITISHKDGIIAIIIDSLTQIKWVELLSVKNSQDKNDLIQNIAPKDDGIIGILDIDKI